MFFPCGYIAYRYVYCLANEPHIHTLDFNQWYRVQMQQKIYIFFTNVTMGCAPDRIHLEDIYC